MRPIREPAIFIILMVLASNAAAEMNKCTDANGNVSFTNLACPTGYVAENVGGNAVVAPANPTFSQQELDQMLAPIALYPDPLLLQILMAATYPLEVVQAARWSSANPELKGDAAVQAVSSQNWDPSVKSLVAFPQVLQTMDRKIEWTERLGDAFLAQQAQVMDTVQRLRQKAQQAGNLSSTSESQVNQSNDSIQVEPANPGVVYVPYYDPQVVYGAWWWPDYPPVYWDPWVGYGWDGGFAWGPGIGIGAGFFYGSCDWHSHNVYWHNYPYSGQGHPWHHDPDHRHGVPYRDMSLNQQFGRISATPAPRAEFRGYEQGINARTGAYGNRVPAAPGRTAPVPEQRRTMPARNIKPPAYEPRPHAFENVGRGADVRGFSARGNASLSGRSFAPAPSRGFSQPAPSHGGGFSQPAPSHGGGFSGGGHR